MSYLSTKEITSIYKRYSARYVDALVDQKYDNLEKNQPWILVKNNTKTNKYKKKQIKDIYKPYPYKFMSIPSNMRTIILNLCQTNKISLQTLAVKINIQLHVLDNYLNYNKSIDNYDLSLILDYFDYDLVSHIDKLNNIEN